jgi:hypothetical protein
MTAKAFLINQPATVVSEALEGFVAATPHLSLLDGFPQVNGQALLPAPCAAVQVGGVEPAAGRAWPGRCEFLPSGAWVCHRCATAARVCYMNLRLLLAGQGGCGHQT